MSRAEPFDPDESLAILLDRDDPLAAFRDRFHLPQDAAGGPAAYFCGNSLGLQPRETARLVGEELDDWAKLAVEGHFDGRRPWYAYHEQLRESAARLVGARPGEVVMMNGLTVNLHLLLVSFYRPTGKRHRILIEDCAFPSDGYAVRSQLRYHGRDPEASLLIARPRAGERTLRDDDLVELIERHADELTLVLLGGVNYYTGQLFDLARVAAAGRRAGAVVGFDLAHAAGNVPLALHDWEVDFAVWCSYKYLNAGPGAVAGCFVHERHAKRSDLPRFAGWWGNDPKTRFRMHLEPEFVPAPGADGWQLSNPPILAAAPLLASLELFDAAGMEALGTKSRALTGYLEAWIGHAAGKAVEIVTPREPGRRGCQLSLLVPSRARELNQALRAAGIVADYREPDVVRVAPVPLYNTFHEVWRFGQALAAWARAA